MSKASMVFLLILVAGVFIRYNHGKPRTFLMETVKTEDNTMDPKDYNNGVGTNDDVDIIYVMNKGVKGFVKLQT